LREVGKGLKERTNAAVLHDGMWRRRHNKEERSWSTHVREGREDRCTSVVCIHAETEGRGWSTSALYSYNLGRGLRRNNKH